MIVGLPFFPFAEKLIGSKAFATEPTKCSWNQFRGPTADGKSHSPNLPIQWNETRNIRWKTPIQGKAWSSPVVSDNTIWLSNATEDGQRLSLIAVNAKTGIIQKDITVFEIKEPMFCHPFNSYASPTPVCANGFLFVHYGSAGTARIGDLSGRCRAVAAACQPGRAAAACGAAAARQSHSHGAPRRLPQAASARRQAGGPERLGRVGTAMGLPRQSERPRLADATTRQPGCDDADTRGLPGTAGPVNLMNGLSRAAVVCDVAIIKRCVVHA